MSDSPLIPAAAPALDFLTKRLPFNLARWSTHFYAAQITFQVDPFVIAAICSRESEGGDRNNPKGPAGLGDGGFGHGLMQIDKRYHKAFLLARRDDGTLLWTIPAYNILYGSDLLYRSLYTAQHNYLVAIAAYNCGLTKALKVFRSMKPGSGDVVLRAALDVETTGGNYVTDVMRRRNEYLAVSVS